MRKSQRTLAHRLHAQKENEKAIFAPFPANVNPLARPTGTGTPGGAVSALRSDGCQFPLDGGWIDNHISKVEESENSRWLACRDSSVKISRMKQSQVSSHLTSSEAPITPRASTCPPSSGDARSAGELRRGSRAPSARS